jgi:hypothetical protein
LNWQKKYKVKYSLFKTADFLKKLTEINFIKAFLYYPTAMDKLKRGVIFMKYNKILVSLLILTSVATHANGATCNTRETIKIGQSFTCLVPARTISEVSFYINVDSLAKYNYYACHLKSSIVSSFLRKQESTFPEGAVVSFIPENFIFPLTLNIDTTNMKEESDIMTLKYTVSASDYPTDITAICLQSLHKN